MNTKPILFWPKARSEVAHHLDRDDDDFLVVDTNCAYELQKLYNLRPNTPIFDPFPNHGDHYREFIEHVGASDCHCHIVGIEACQKMLGVLKDPLLARSPIEEILAAIEPDQRSRDGSSTAVIESGKRFGTWLHRSIVIDWSSVNWANTIALAILAFAGTVIGIAVSPSNNLVAAVVAAFLVAVMYLVVRADFSKMFSWITGQSGVVAKDPSRRKREPLGLWAKK